MLLLSSWHLQTWLVRIAKVVIVSTWSTFGTTLLAASARTRSVDTIATTTCSGLYMKLPSLWSSLPQFPDLCGDNDIEQTSCHGAHSHPTRNQRIVTQAHSGDSSVFETRRLLQESVHYDHITKQRVSCIQPNAEHPVIVHIGNPCAGICPIVRWKPMFCQQGGRSTLITGQRKHFQNYLNSCKALHDRTLVATIRVNGVTVFA